MSHDHIVEERINQIYAQSPKYGYRYCTGCTSHILLDTLRNNDGYCPGCEQLITVQENIRGAL